MRITPIPTKHGRPEVVDAFADWLQQERRCAFGVYAAAAWPACKRAVLRDLILGARSELNRPHRTDGPGEQSEGTVPLCSVCIF